MNGARVTFRDLPCDVFLPDCPARSVLTLLAEKWSMLIQTLKRLEAAGLVTRTSYAEVPPRVDYALTDLSWSLSPLVKELDQWVAQHAKIIAARPLP